jgi:signal transduction histidine kinase
MTKEEINGLILELDKSQKNVSTLLENLLSWALSQTGKLEYNKEEFDITALLKENEDLLKTQADNKHLTLENTTEGRLIVSAHKNSIDTVVRNLVSNAIKFTPENGKITLSWERKNHEVVVAVCDTGVGMTEDAINKIFLIENKSSNLGTANEKGAGLGLILCKEFVEKNGGTIWVTSEVNVGSKFMFSIPSNV